MTFLAPTKFKAWTTVAIWVSYGVAGWLGDFAGAGAYRAADPKLFAELTESMEGFSGLIQEHESTLRSVTYRFLLAKGSAALVVAYLCAATIAHFGAADRGSRAP